MLSSKRLSGVARAFLLALTGTVSIASAQSVTYEQDRAFPADNAMAFNTVSWLDVDETSRELVLLQRSAPQISFWAAEGGLERQIVTEVLGKPHSIKYGVGPDGEPELWVTDMAPPNPAGKGMGHCVKRLSMQGELVGTIGTSGAKTAGTGLDPLEFDWVTDIALTPDNTIMITDGDIGGLNNRLLEVNLAGDKLERVWTAPGNHPGTGPGEFNLPHAVEYDRCGRTWVADTLNHRIQVFDKDGEPQGALACFGEQGVYGLSVASAAPGNGVPTERIYVSTSATKDPRGGEIWVFEAGGSCAPEDAIPTCAPLANWSIDLTSVGHNAMLHALAVDPATHAIYLAVLGGELPPQKWVLKQE